MLLFEGYMGTILHTGDFRFTNRMFEENNILYPTRKSNPDHDECSIHIDEVIMDDTYCDPIFKFPKRVIISEIFDINFIIRKMHFNQ